MSGKSPTKSCDLSEITLAVYWYVKQHQTMNKLEFWMLENFAVINLKVIQEPKSLNDANGMATMKTLYE